MAHRALTIGPPRQVDSRDDVDPRDDVLRRSLAQGERAVNAREVWDAQRRRVAIVYGLRLDDRDTVLATHYILRWFDTASLHPATFDANGIDRRAFDHIEQVRQYLDEIAPRWDFVPAQETSEPVNFESWIRERPDEDEQRAPHIRRQRALLLEMAAAAEEAGTVVYTSPHLSTPPLTAADLREIAGGLR